MVLVGGEADFLQRHKQSESPEMREEDGIHLGSHLLLPVILHSKRSHLPVSCSCSLFSLFVFDTFSAILPRRLTTQIDLMKETRLSLN